MLRSALKSTAVLVLLGTLAATPGAAQQGDPTPGARGFAAFLGYSAPICLAQSAPACVEAGWRFADRDRSGTISLGEFETVREELRAWLAWPGNGIRPAERRGVLLGLMIVKAVGLARLVESYDSDGDAALSRAELLSDVTLDQRPLGEVLSDSSAVDWDSLRRRLGALAPALGTIAPSGEE